MLDIGWSELAVIAVLALIIIGPKDLPAVMRTMGQWMRKARSVTREFQSSIDEMVREAELEDARKAIDDAKHLNVERVLEDTVDPTGSVREEARELEQTARSTDEESAAPAPAAQETEKTDASAAEDSEAKAKVIEHPVQMAPPHSLTPPPEPANEAPDTPAEKAASGQKGG